MDTPRRFIVLAALALVGFGISVYQTQHFFDFNAGAAGFASFCNINELFNCDAVESSRFAQLIPGFPLSSFAVGWFITLFIVSLVARDPFSRRDALRFLLILTSIASFFSLIYLGVMLAIIKKLCLLCLIIDAINFISLAIVLSLKPEGTHEHKPDKEKWKLFAWLTVVPLVVSVLGLKIGFSKTVPSDLKEQAIERVMNESPVNIDDSDKFPTIGPKDAPITIVKFSDFQCPACKRGAFVLHPITQKFPDKVRIVYRNFPLDGSCNREIEQRVHPAACEAAKIAVCANEQGLYKKFYERVFEKQDNLERGKVWELVSDLGIDKKELDACLASSRPMDMIKGDIEEAIRLEVKSTPTFFINGRKVEGALPTSVWEELINKLLAKP